MLTRDPNHIGEVFASHAVLTTGEYANASNLDAIKRNMRMQLADAIVGAKLEVTVKQYHVELTMRQAVMSMAELAQLVDAEALAITKQLPPDYRPEPPTWHAERETLIDRVRQLETLLEAAKAVPAAVAALT